MLGAWNSIAEKFGRFAQIFGLPLCKNAEYWGFFRISSVFLLKNLFLRVIIIYV